jgi:hypothetical protein
MVSTDTRPASRRLRPASVVVEFNGHPHRVDMRVVELAFFRKVVEGKLDSRLALADATGLSRSTVSRFVAGKGASIHVALRILAELDLRFDDVATPIPVHSDDPV